MSSAFRTFTSAAGLGSACYLLAMASWDQVLLLFASAGLGWCVFVWHHERHKAAYGPRHVAKRTTSELLEEMVAPPKRGPELPAFIESRQQVQPSVVPRRTVYKFPIHELAKSGLPSAADAVGT